ncbi:MAG: TIGR03619 family F420-dependent LLM class oxidoreductase [Acidimicrobiales bacterium]
MRIGATLAFDGGRGRGMAELAEASERAEAVGLDSLWFPEHVVFVEGARSQYPYGTLAMGKRPGVYDPLIAMTVAAGVTSRVRLGTGVLILPQREPLTLAQQVVAVDHASGGRVDLGIGVGWLREEFEALGVPWARRGARADEYVAALRTAWRDEVSNLTGEFSSFAGVLAYPKPAQAGGPPILVGGNTPAALDRARRLGDGWFGWALTVDEVATAIDALGGVPATVGLAWPRPFDALVDYAKALAQLGVRELVVAPGTRDVPLGDRLAGLAEALDGVRASTGDG